MKIDKTKLRSLVIQEVKREKNQREKLRERQVDQALTTLVDINDDLHGANDGSKLMMDTITLVSRAISTLKTWKSIT